MTDGREEPSACYKLGNGWVILHWCANLTIILTGFTFIPARINAQPDGQVFIVCAIVQVAVLVAGQSHIKASGCIVGLRDFVLKDFNTSILSVVKVDVSHGSGGAGVRQIVKPINAVCPRCIA